jgi:hypothetical protein
VGHLRCLCPEQGGDLLNFTMPTLVKITPTSRRVFCESSCNGGIAYWQERLDGSRHKSRFAKAATAWRRPARSGQIVTVRARDVHTPVTPSDGKTGD